MKGATSTRRTRSDCRTRSACSASPSRTREGSQSPLPAFLLPCNRQRKWRLSQSPHLPFVHPSGHRRGRRQRLLPPAPFRKTKTRMIGLPPQPFPARTTSQARHDPCCLRATLRTLWRESMELTPWAVLSSCCLSSDRATAAPAHPKGWPQPPIGRQMCPDTANRLLYRCCL